MPEVLWLMRPVVPREFRCGGDAKPVSKARECDNLLVPVCLAASHIAYGSIRKEPVFMILGQSAATAAILAIEGKVPVQEIS